MNSLKIKLALASCTLALAACGTGNTETDKASIEDVGSSAYQQALGADGDVDCDRIHEALHEVGIDPAQLEPEIVFEACLNSGTDEATCQLVAYTCFGDQGCHDPDPEPTECDEFWQIFGDDPDLWPPDGSNDPDYLFQRCVDLGYPDDICVLAYECLDDPNPPQPEPECQELYDLAQQMGLDPSDVNADEMFQQCMDVNYPEEICHNVWACFPIEPGPQPQPEPLCDDAYVVLQDLNVDPADDLTIEEFLNLCVDAGYGEDFCWEVATSCHNPDPGPDPEPNPLHCAEVVQELQDHGIQIDYDEAMGQDGLYMQCVAQTNDDQGICELLLDCEM